MKIVFIAPDFPPEIGGMQVSAYELAKGLSLTNQVIVYTLRKNKLDNDVGNATVKPILMDKYFLDLIPVLLEIKKDKPDLVHIYNAGISILGLMINLVFKIPYVVTVHGKDLLAPFKGPVLFRRELALLGCSRANQIHAVSEGVAQKICAKLKKVKVISHGVDTKKFRVIPKSRSLDKKIILSVGRLEKRKGFDRVIECLPALISEIPNLYYTIVGDGPDKGRLIAKIDQHSLQERVNFAGYASEENLIEYYNLADVFVMVPREIEGDIEGFGLVYLEANACGTPVIGSFSGGVSSAIINGKTGLLVDQDSPAEIKEAIKRILGDSEFRNKLIEGGLQHARKNSWEMVAKRMNELYKGALNVNL